MLSNNQFTRCFYKTKLIMSITWKADMPTFEVSKEGDETHHRRKIILNLCIACLRYIEPQTEIATKKNCQNLIGLKFG